MGIPFSEDGNSYYKNVANNGRENEMKLCIRALGGGKSWPTKSKPEKLQKAQGVAQKVANTEAVNLKCIKDSNDVLTSFYTFAEKDPRGAFLTQIEKLNEEQLGKALDSIKGEIGGTTEQKMKNFSFVLFGNPIAEIGELYGITGGIMETASLTTSLAFDWGAEKGEVSLAFLRGAVRSQLDKRIGAREASQMADWGVHRPY